MKLLAKNQITVIVVLDQMRNTSREQQFYFIFISNKASSWISPLNGYDL